jgi:hypothetical protein
METNAARIFSAPRGYGTPLWSPDGKYLVYKRLEDRNGDSYDEIKLWIIQVSDGKQWTISE